MKKLLIIVVLAIAATLFFEYAKKESTPTPKEVPPPLSIIDVHEHIELMGRATQLKDAMINRNISKTVLIPSPIETITLNGNKTFTEYEKNIDTILEIAKTYPEQFIPFCTISPLDKNALEIFKNCHERGGKGLKLYNGHSFYYETFSMKLDDERMQPIYTYAQENDLPILYHVNINKYIDELKRVLDGYPDLKVTVPHLMIASEELNTVGQLLDTYPNLYTDISFGFDPFHAAGFRRIHESNNEFQTFFNTYSDRILFGTDMVLTDHPDKNQAYMEEILQCYQDVLEQREYECDPISHFYNVLRQSRTGVYRMCKLNSEEECTNELEKMNEAELWYAQSSLLTGLDLPQDVLEKIYQKNPAKWLGI